MRTRAVALPCFGPLRLMEKISLESLDASFFEGRSGSDYLLMIEGGPITLLLERVRPLGHRRNGALRDPFALEFRGPSGIRLPQGIYPLQCEGMETLEIFLVQVADKPDGSLFEAVFT